MSERILEDALPTAPAPDPQARERALALAMKRFEEFHPERQGTLDSARPMDREGTTPSDHRGRSMKTKTSKLPAIAASVAALMAVGVAGIVITDPHRNGRPTIASTMRDTGGEGGGVFHNLQPPSNDRGAVDRIRQAFRPDPSSAPPAPTSRTTEPAGSGDGSYPTAQRAAPQASTIRDRNSAEPQSPPAPINRYQPETSQERAPTGAPRETPRQDAPAVEEPSGRDKFSPVATSGYVSVAQQPTSTFSMDVDTASYGFAKASVARGQLPPPESVRTEEFLNAFSYGYPAPASTGEPIRTSVTIVPSPWNEGRQLMHVGIKAVELKRTERPRANIVLLVDTSGSMSAANRLPLARRALEILVNNLETQDTVSIVTYAGSAGVALRPTTVLDSAAILKAIASLQAGGGTAGFDGIQTAYALAKENFDPKGVNRVILVTDGDFNVGISDPGRLKSYVESQRSSGVYLTALGFGMGNYNDRTMQALAQAGNGQAAFVGSLDEARKILADQITGSLVTVADDAKIQIEFNPASVSEYRLLGYEKRALRHQDFANDKVDAGDVGSGHTVTALYEIVPVGGRSSAPSYRYQAAPDARAPAPGEELATVAVRYKVPGQRASKLAETRVKVSDALESFDAANDDTRFAVAVAGMAEVLRQSPHASDANPSELAAKANAARGRDEDGARAEFVRFARSAAALLGGRGR